MNVYLNIKMENNSSGKKKKGVSWVVDKFLNLFLIACGVVVIWILLQVTSIATFKIPSDSMEPALLAGDNILVNKWVMGGRIFNIWDALEGKEVKISRYESVIRIFLVLAHYHCVIRIPHKHSVCTSVFLPQTV